MILRKATIDDAEFIALAVVEALGDDIMERESEGLGKQDSCRLSLLAGSIRTDGTLYCWRHTTIAEDEGGNYVGAMVAYPGDNYMEMRSRTFSMLKDLITFDVEAMDPEAVEGEYYLDSVAILPSYRGKGYGRKFLRAYIDEARALSRPAVLACDPENLGAKALYESVGFRHSGDLFIFGHHYLRMVAE